VLGKTAWQLTTTVGLFAASSAAMYAGLHISFFLTLALAIPTGALLVRVFILQHDCGHGSLFRSRRANNIMGTACSLLTLAPYASWRRHHAGHHGNWNNLDRRLSGADIYSSCITVNEYKRLPCRRRLLYRISRHPIVAHLLVPPFVFVVLYRFPFDMPRSWKRERRAVYLTNVAILALLAALGSLLGFGNMLVVQPLTIFVASIIGVWLFALQHRFDGTQWLRQQDWNFVAASLDSSSYLRLPKLLQWCTGNIGFHHVHHFAPRVPNYRLEECYVAVPALQSRAALSVGAGLRSVWLTLWDEDREKLVRISEVRLETSNVPSDRCNSSN
jgi:omega-6 fatty acid desaturase (delta-12 desaturase)